MITSMDGQTPRHDIKQQRISNGTLGDSFMTPRSVPGSSINAIIDDQDPRIAYGIFTALGGATMTTTAARGGSFDFGGTSTFWTDLLAGCTFRFTGTSIGVLARTNPKCSDIDVYIDGVLTPGRILSFNQLLSAGVDATNGYSPSRLLSATATSIYMSTVDSVDQPGTILIDRELISYQAYAANTGGGYVLTGVTRGASGTTAASHTWSAIAYKWSSNAPLNSGVGITTYTQKNLVYYNPFLSPGDHYIAIVLKNRGGMPNTSIYFDGFLIGSLLGAQNLYTRLGTTVVTGATDASGFVDFGSLSTVGGVSIVGLIGYEQTTPDGTSGGTVGKLCSKADTNTGELKYYYANGPGSTTVSVKIWFMYLGESI